MNTNIAPTQAVSSKFEYVKFSSILLFLVVAATLMGTLDGFNGLEWIRWFMGGFMIIFGGLKLLGIEVFTKVAPLYDLIAKRFRPYRYVYPLLQVFLGILFIIGILPLVTYVTALVVSLSALIGMIGIVSKKGPIRLSYLGTIIGLRFSTVSIFENTTIIVLSIIMLAAEVVL